MSWIGTGNLKSGDVTMFYSGPNNGKHENGVGFIKKTRENSNQSITIWYDIYEYIIISDCVILPLRVKYLIL